MSGLDEFAPTQEDGEVDYEDEKVAYEDVLDGGLIGILEGHHHHRDAVAKLTAPPPEKPTRKRGAPAAQESTDRKRTRATPHAPLVEPISPAPAPLHNSADIVDEILRTARGGMVSVLNITIERLSSVHNGNMHAVEQTLRASCPELMSSNAYRTCYNGWATVRRHEGDAPDAPFPLAMDGMTVHDAANAFYVLQPGAPKPTLVCPENAITNPAALLMLALVFDTGVINLVFSRDLLTVEHLRVLAAMSAETTPQDDIKRFEHAFLQQTSTPAHLLPSCPPRIVGHVVQPNFLLTVQPSTFYSVVR